MKQISYVTKFTVDICYTWRFENFTTYALSQVTINNVECFWDGVDSEAVDAAQKKRCKSYRIFSLSWQNLFEARTISNKSSSLSWCDTSTGILRSFLPESFRTVIFEKVYLLSHPNITVSITLIGNRFVWPNRRQDVTSWVRTCLSCQGNRVQRIDFSEFKQFALPTDRFEEINLTLVGPLPQFNDCSYILTMINKYSRY